MAEYTLDDLFEEVTIKIGDHQFRLRERTRSLSRKAGEVMKAFGELDEEDDERGVELMIDLVDVMLEPLGNGNGTRSHAKTLLLKAWKSDQIGADRIMGLGQFCQTKLEERLDPTSPPASGN